MAPGARDLEGGRRNSEVVGPGDRRRTAYANSGQTRASSQILTDQPSSTSTATSTALPSTSPAVASQPSNALPSQRTPVFTPVTPDRRSPSSPLIMAAKPADSDGAVDSTSNRSTSLTLRAGSQCSDNFRSPPSRAGTGLVPSIPAAGSRTLRSSRAHLSSPQATSHNTLVSWNQSTLERPTRASTRLAEGAFDSIIKNDERAVRAFQNKPVLVL